MVNNCFVVIILGLVSVFNIYLFRNFFIVILEEIFEFVKMDGVSIVRIFFRIMFLMFKFVVVIVGVLLFILSWNDYIWLLMVLIDFFKFLM